MSKRERIMLAEVEMWPLELQEEYLSLVRSGTEPMLAHMLVSRQAPTMGMASDRQFNSSYRRKMSNMSERNRDKICGIAQKAGINTNGKYYVGGLGRYNDPRAWVSTADDVQRVCREKNLTAHGPGVSHKGTPVDRKPGPKLAPDIVNDLRRTYLQRDPKLREQVSKSRSKSMELNEKIIAKHGKKKD